MKKYPWQFTKDLFPSDLPLDYNEELNTDHWEGNPMLERLKRMISDEPNDQRLGARLREYIRSMG